MMAGRIRRADTGSLTDQNALKYKIVKQNTLPELPHMVFFASTRPNPFIKRKKG